jgi:uncharacterized protein
LTITKSPVSSPGDSDDLRQISSQTRRGLIWKRRFAALARWLHTYLSLFSFAILLFFAVTGLTLNHAEWFDNQERTTQYQGAVDKTWVSTSDPKDVAKLEVVEYLRRTHGITSALGDFRVDDGQCAVLFKGPGYEANAVIDRDTGKYELTVSRFGFVAVLNDLHKGRDTGAVWSAVIDVSAALMTFVSLTGITLIFFLTKRRFSGLLAFAVGALLCYLVYILWVP